MRVFSFILLAILLPSTVLHASILEDRILVLPPTAGVGYDRSTGDLWRMIDRGYREGVAGVDVIPMEDVIIAMEGDTLTFDLMMIGEAIEWGKRLDADFVILAETLGQDVSLQRLDPWTGELFGPIDAEGPFHAIRTLERDRWVYGRKLLPPPGDYVPPRLENADRKVTGWLHENEEYPPDALIELMGCSANVQVTVTPQGVPQDIRILSVDQPDYGFEAAIAKALWTMRFEPARRGDNVVHGMWISTVNVSPVQ